MRNLLTLAALSLLASCGSPSDDAADVAEKPADPAPAKAENSSTPQETSAGQEEMLYGLKSYPGATDYFRWDTSNNGIEGATVSFKSTASPKELGDYYEAAARENGLTVTSRDDRSNGDVVLIADRADGEGAFYVSFSPKGEGSMTQFMFKKPDA
ncbi:hypothetical protein [Sphingomicrobium nitratireducens]|uniref:hypothetical protein n=1 Tax=Sphingomicrobium nitratireducens TaxID=2964666 RepID=UPI002240474E|nr:hypothetical protein [Sphingomicrobium nitratireducens]